MREHVFVDAHAGVVIEHYTLVHEALFRRLYETDLGNEIWTEGDALPGALDIWQQNELAAASHTYQFFDNAFGWASYDDADAEMLTINNDPGIDCPNATWNGSNAGYCTGTASDDVVAHEWGHAYTQFTNGLIYAWQSGGLNESYSDIWGETIDLLNGYEDAGENLSLRASCGSSDRWRMGEDASAFGGAIRDMWDPTCNGDPGKVSDGQYVCSSGDSGGVHSNSGVPNHVYALLVDGGSYNGETISALGFTKAAHIHWRAQAFYETVTTDFFAHADALEQACDDLIGINLEGLSTGAAAGPSGEIITLADCQEVADVALATELREEACPGQFEPLLDPDAPSLCSTGVPTEVELYDFESGLGSWTVGQLPENPGSWDSRDWTLTASLPAGRAGSGVYGPDPLFGDCQADLDNGIIYLQSPPIVIPGGTPAAVRLAFDHYVSTEPNWDGGNLKYSTDGVNFFLIPSGAFVFNAYNTTLNSAAGDGNDNPMESEPAFSGSDAGTVAGSWGQTQINLAAVGVAPGETVHFRWELGTDGCNGFDGWYVDDVHIYGCDPGPCGVEPALGCKTADPLKGLGKSSVTVKISSDASSGLLKWKWNKGAATDLGDFLDPVASGAATYHVCVFDDSANIQPLYEAAIPSLGTCRDKPCWKAAGSTKYKFKDRDASNASVSVMTLKAGTDGKSQIQVKAKGVSVSTISPPLSLNVTVQFIADDGLSPSCWQTTFSTEKSNKDRSFKAKGP
ncbi:MAG: bacillolysin [Hyphomicrobiaceae bacterium]